MNQTQLTGALGLYLACYRLTLRRWNVAPTARNAKGVDIIAYHMETGRSISIQVKALSKLAPVPLGRSVDGLMGDFWMILPGATSPDCPTYILTPEEVRSRAFRSAYASDGGAPGYWLQPRGYAIPEFHDAFDRLTA